jgi:hypothetical protein
VSPFPWVGAKQGRYNNYKVFQKNFRRLISGIMAAAHFFAKTLFNCMQPVRHLTVRVRPWALKKNINLLFLKRKKYHF